MTHPELAMLVSEFGAAWGPRLAASSLILMFTGLLAAGASQWDALVLLLLVVGGGDVGPGRFGSWITKLVDRSVRPPSLMGVGEVIRGLRILGALRDQRLGSMEVRFGQPCLPTG